MDVHPDVRVEVRITPDPADQRHQLYVQWLNARAPAPDILQLVLAFQRRVVQGLTAGAVKG